MRREMAPGRSRMVRGERVMEEKPTGHREEEQAEGCPQDKAQVEGRNILRKKRLF